MNNELNQSIEMNNEELDTVAGGNLFDTIAATAIAGTAAVAVGVGITAATDGVGAPVGAEAGADTYTAVMAGLAAGGLV